MMKRNTDHNMFFKKKQNPGQSKTGITGYRRMGAFVCAGLLAGVTVLSDVSVVQAETAKEEKNVDKEETVYIFSDAQGTVDHTIVSSWLKNKTGAATIDDASELTDIENVKGDETYTKKGDTITWQADGADIYYQGTTDKQAPISVKLSYELDGKPVKPEELAGKSGDVKIRFDYTNHETKEVTIDGKKETFPVPFGVLSALVLDNEHFSNIAVTNGKVISEGNNSIVVGIAVPGLKDSLALSGGEDAVSSDSDNTDVEIPEYVEITATAKDFQLDMTMTVVVNDLLSDLSFDTDGKLDEAKDSMDDLSDASKQLVDGSSKLNDGAKELSDGTEKLTDGSDKLVKGTKELSDGAALLNGKMGEFGSGVNTLNNGIIQYTGGVKKLAKGSSDLKSGTDKLAKSLPKLTQGVAALKQGATDAKAGADQLTSGYAGDGTAQNPGAAKAATQIADGLAQLNTAVSALTLPQAEATDAQKQAATQAVTQALLSEENQAVIRQQAAQGAAAALGTDENKQALAQTVASVYQALVQSGTVSANDASMQAVTQIVGAALSGTAQSVAQAAATGAVNASAGTIASIGANTASELTLQNVRMQLASFEPQMQLLKTSVAQLAEGSRALDRGINGYTAADGTYVTGLYDGTVALAKGLGDLSDGINQLDAKSGTLSKGVSSLSEGAKSLKDGANELNKNSAALTDGSAKVADATKQISKGVASLADGAGKLDSGAKELNSGTGELAKGAKQLYEGTGDLYDGMLTFDEEGIQKLTNLFDDELQPLLDRLSAMKDAGADYNNFSGLADGKSGSVKFIVKTAPVKTE